MGKKSRAAGMRFEKKVREDLEKKKFIVDKWTNNVEFEVVETISIPITQLKSIFCVGRKGKLIPAKPKFIFNPITKTRQMIGNNSGFPDFIAFRYGDSCDCGHECGHIEGVECKMDGYLDKEEKEKCQWYLDNNIFSEILIASKGKKRGEIIYKEFIFS